MSTLSKALLISINCSMSVFMNLSYPTTPFNIYMYQARLTINKTNNKLTSEKYNKQKTLSKSIEVCQYLSNPSIQLLYIYTTTKYTCSSISYSTYIHYLQARQTIGYFIVGTFDMLYFDIIFLYSQRPSQKFCRNLIAVHHEL